MNTEQVNMLDVLLGGGVEVWHRYRKENPGAEINLRGAPLRGRDLVGVDLSGADLADADLSGARLYGADLAGANCIGTILTGADLRRANFEEASISKDTRFSEANVWGTRGLPKDVFRDCCPTTN